MKEESISQEFRLKNIEEKKYFLKEIDQNELTSKKQKKVTSNLNHTEYLLISVSAITGCVSVSDFASLLGISTGITSSAIGLINCAITAAIKNISQ